MVVEQFDHRLMPARQCKIERRLIIIGVRLLHRTMRQQQLRHLQISILSGLMERCPSALLPRIDIGAMCQQNPNDFDVASSRGRMQRRILHGVSGAGMHVRAVREQRVGAARVAEECRKVQRSPAIVAVHAGEGSIARKQLRHALARARHGSRADVERRASIEEKLRHGVLASVSRCCVGSKPALVVRVQQPGVGIDHLTDSCGVAGAYGVKEFFIHSGRWGKDLLGLKQFPAEVIHVE